MAVDRSRRGGRGDRSGNERPQSLRRWRLVVTGEDFRYPALKPPYTLTTRFRKCGDRAPFESTVTHANSLIGLLNTPIGEG